MTQIQLTQDVDQQMHAELWLNAEYSSGDFYACSTILRNFYLLLFGPQSLIQVKTKHMRTEDWSQWDREVEGTGYSGTEGIRGLVMVGRCCVCVKSIQLSLLHVCLRMQLLWSLYCLHISVLAAVKVTVTVFNFLVYCSEAIQRKAVAY